MIDIERLNKYSRAELLDIAGIYSDYALSHTDKYEDAVKSRIGLSAFFDTAMLAASKEKVSEIYKKSPQLEVPDILCTKLNALTDEQLCDLLADYDCYIIGLDEYSNNGVAPVCLNEFLDEDYLSCKTNLLCDRLKTQMDAYEEILIAEGAKAMRKKNKKLLDIVERFYEAFCNYDYDDKALEAAASLAREAALIPAIVDWAGKQDIYLDLIPNTPEEFFDQFCMSKKNGK